MCGFLGIFSNTELADKLDYKFIEETIRHRGPDSHKKISYKNHFLGIFSRLSINDLSSNSDQPMISPCKQYAILYNGEIYNFKPLKAKLIHCGWNFKTTGDTEVLLAGLVTFGEDFIREIDGIFAFVFYNNKEKSIILSRDRIGIKPLYYHITNDNKPSLFFGSEMQFITKCFKRKFKLNNEAISEYFKYKYIAGTRTLVDGVRSLRPGSYLKVNVENINNYVVIDYFNINLIEPTHQTNVDLENQILEVLSCSIKDQLHSDAKLGLQISGGVDSTIIAAIASSLSFKPESSYFVSMVDTIHDESYFANEVSSKFEYPINTIKLNEEEYFGSLDSVASFHDSPINHPHAAAIYLLSKKAKENVKVLVSGEGADELCFGYLRYNRDKLKRNSDIISNYSFLESDKEKSLMKKIFSKYDHEQADNTRKEILSEIPDYSTLNRFRLFELNCHLQDLLLRYDRMLMANSIEGRVPFLSNNFIQLCLSNDGESFYKKSEGKVQLKSIADNFMNSGFSSRKKVGFRIPLNEWVGTKLFRQDTTLIENLTDNKNLNADTIIDLNKKLIEGEEIESYMKFYSLLSNLNRWIDHHSIDWD